MLLVFGGAWAAACAPSQPTGDSDKAAARAACVEDAKFPACAAFRRSATREEIPGYLEELRQRQPDHWLPHYEQGKWYQVQREEALAVQAFRDAAASAAALGDEAGRLECLYMLCFTAVGQRDYDSAEPACDSARDIAGRLGDDRARGQAIYQLSQLYWNRGRYTEQRDALNQVLELRGPQNSFAVRALLHSLAGAQRRLGRLAEAREAYDRVIEFSEETDPSMLARGLVSRCGLSMDQAAYEAAIVDCERAAAVAAEAEEAGLEALGHGQAAHARAQLGAFDEAAASLESALAEVDTLDPWGRLSTWTLAGHAERLSGGSAAAEAHYRRAQALAEEIDEQELAWESSVGLALLARADGRLDDAVAHASDALARVERLRSIVGEDQSLTHFLQWRSEVYRVLAAALADRDPGNLEPAFRVVEQAHARTLAEALAETSSEELAIEAPLASVQRRLRPGDLLVEYLLGEDESLLFAVTRDSTRVHVLPPRIELERDAERYRSALMRPLTALDARLDPLADFRRHRGTGRRLYERLLGPVGGELAAASRLFVVPDRKLHLLPFEALPVRAPGPGEVPEFLGVRLPIAYLPAAGLLASSNPSAALRSALVLANDNASREAGLAALENAAQEAESVARVYGPDRARLFVGGEATADRLLHADAGPIDVLHVVAHTILEGRSGPRVLLAGGSSLDARNVRSLSSPPRIAVLSCCDTAQGELVGGEGILGLVRSFMIAGTPDVVATLWMVDDAAAVDLMQRFHVALAAGEQPAEALRRARAEALAGGFVHPFYWAPFVLYGAG